MILFGSRTWSKILATLTLVCRHCGNPAANHVVTRSTWFTLFFIPVVPLYVRRSVTCTFCGMSSKLTKADADQLVSGGQGAPAYSQQPWPDQQQPQQPGQPRY